MRLARLSFASLTGERLAPGVPPPHARRAHHAEDVRRAQVGVDGGRSGRGARRARDQATKAVRSPHGGGGALRPWRGEGREEERGARGPGRRRQASSAWARGRAGARRKRGACSARKGPRARRRIVRGVANGGAALRRWLAGTPELRRHRGLGRGSSSWIERRPLRRTLGRAGTANRWPRWTNEDHRDRGRRRCTRGRGDREAPTLNGRGRGAREERSDDEPAAGLSFLPRRISSRRSSHRRPSDHRRRRTPSHPEAAPRPRRHRRVESSMKRGSGGRWNDGQDDDDHADAERDHRAHGVGQRTPRVRLAAVLTRAAGRARRGSLGIAIIPSPPRSTSVGSRGPMISRLIGWTADR